MQPLYISLRTIAVRSNQGIRIYRTVHFFEERENGLRLEVTEYDTSTKIDFRLLSGESSDFTLRVHESCSCQQPEYENRIEWLYAQADTHIQTVQSMRLIRFFDKWLKGHVESHPETRKYVQKFRDGLNRIQVTPEDLLTTLDRIPFADVKEELGVVIEAAFCAV